MKHVTLTEREQNEYRLTRGIMALVANEENPKCNENCFELEVSQEIEKKADATVKRHGGMFVPWNVGIDPALVRAAYDRLERAGLIRAGIRTALATGTANQGKEVVFADPGAFIDYLYNRMLLKTSGAQTISGLQGNVAFPKQTGRATGSWVVENPGADVADSNPSLGQIILSPKTRQATTAYSRQLLAQAVVEVDMLVRADLAKDSALAIDAAGFVGDGVDGSPTGIMNTNGVQAFTLKNDRRRYKTCMGWYRQHGVLHRERERGRTRSIRLGEDSRNQSRSQAHAAAREYGRTARLGGR